MRTAHQETDTLTLELSELCPVDHFAGDDIPTPSPALAATITGLSTVPFPNTSWGAEGGLPDLVESTDKLPT